LLVKCFILDRASARAHGLDTVKSILKLRHGETRQTEDLQDRFMLCVEVIHHNSYFLLHSGCNGEFSGKLVVEMW